MVIRHRLYEVVAVGAGIAAASLMVAGAAVAGPPYTVAANGVTSGPFAATATSPILRLRNIRSGMVLDCMDSAAALSGSLGSHAGGSGLAQVNSLSFTTCSGFGGLASSVSTSPSPANPAQLNGAGSTSATGVTSGTLSNLKFSLAFPLPGNLACDVVFSGSPTDTNVPAALSASFTNGSGSTMSSLGISSGPTTSTAQLWASSVTGTGTNNGACLAGAIQQGDAYQFVGNYSINVTSPANGNPLTIDG